MTAPLPASPAALVFERHHLAIYRFLRRATGDGAAAEDLTQDVFLRIVRSLDRYEDRLQERAWVFRIARNVLLDRHRRSQRLRPDLSLEVVPEVAVDASQARTFALQEALAGLRHEEREAFLLREVAGLGYEEIGGVVAATADAVRMRIYRARASLRSWLGGSVGSSVGVRRETVR
jgi:RNA polymerase sigma factor (sigma-70 family)